MAPCEHAAQCSKALPHIVREITDLQNLKCPIDYGANGWFVFSLRLMMDSADPCRLGAVIIWTARKMPLRLAVRSMDHEKNHGFCNSFCCDHERISRICRSQQQLGCRARWWPGWRGR